MPKLNKTQKYAICWLNSQGKSDVEISDELNISKKQVNDTIARNKTTIMNNIPTKTEPVFKKPTVKDLMITKTSSKKNNTVAIMTKEASEAADALRTQMSPKLSKNIFRLNKDK